MGSWIHYTIDFLMISMILAGIKEATGYSLALNHIAHTKDSIAVLDKYLGLGEKLFAWSCRWAKNSNSFKLTQIPGKNQIKDVIDASKKLVNIDSSDRK